MVLKPCLCNVPVLRKGGAKNNKTFWSFTFLAPFQVLPSLSSLHLQPLPGSSSSSFGAASGSGGSKRKREGQDEMEKMRKQIANLEGRLRNQGKGKSSNQGGKSKGKGKMPAELRGMEAYGPDGDSRCFSFNLVGCCAARAGQPCPKGWHVCMRQGCGKAHSQRDHAE